MAAPIHRVAAHHETVDHLARVRVRVWVGVGVRVWVKVRDRARAPRRGPG